MRIETLLILKRSSRRGFTMIEMITVVGVVGLLAGLLMPVVNETRKKARVVACTSNMKQFKYGLEMWNTEHDRFVENYPDRLTNLWVERYVSDPRIFICPLDFSQGREGGKPPSCEYQFPELDEGPGFNKANDSGEVIGPAKCDPEASLCSYMYEFSGAPCDWWEDWVENQDGFSPYGPGDVTIEDLQDGIIDETEIIDTNWDLNVTWQETKFYQMRYGDIYLHQFLNWELGYTPTWFPIVRCFWHQKNPDTDKQKDVLNLAEDGNIFGTGAKWELVAVKYIDPDYDPELAEE